MVIKYENGKIYKIIGNIPTDPCYVGSTTKDYLSQRMAKHKNDYEHYLSDNKSSKTMVYILFEKYGVENCKIVLLENYKCSSRDELRMREQHYLDQLCCVNRNKAFRSIDDKRASSRRSRAKFKDIRNAQKKEYRIINAEKIRLQKSLKYQCIYCDNEYNYNHKSRHERTSRHIDNTIDYMKSIVDKYTKQTNMGSNIIQHFSLE